MWALLPRLQNTENPLPSTSMTESIAGDGAGAVESVSEREATGMSSFAGLLRFNRGEEGGEEQEGVVEGMGRESMRGSVMEEELLLLVLLLKRENTGELGTATKQDILRQQRWHCADSCSSSCSSRKLCLSFVSVIMRGRERDGRGYLKESMCLP